MSSWKNSSWCERATNQHIIALKTTVTQRVDTTVPVALAFLGRQTQTQSTWHRRESHFSDSLAHQHTKSAKSGCFPSLLFDTWRVLEDVSPIFTIIFRLKALEKYAVEISWGATGIYHFFNLHFSSRPRTATEWLLEQHQTWAHRCCNRACIQSGNFLFVQGRNIKSNQNPKNKIENM